MRYMAFKFEQSPLTRVAWCMVPGGYHLTLSCTLMAYIVLLAMKLLSTSSSPLYNNYARQRLSETVSLPMARDYRYSTDVH